MDCGMVPRRSNFRYKSVLILLQNEKIKKYSILLLQTPNLYVDSNLVAILTEPSHEKKKPA